MASEHHSLVISNDRYPRKLLHCKKRESSSLRGSGERLITNSTFCSLVTEAQKHPPETLLQTEPKANKLYQGITADIWGNCVTSL